MKYYTWLSILLIAFQYYWMKYYPWLLILLDETHLRLVGVTAMLLTCKYEEVFVPLVDDFIQIAYTREEVLQMVRSPTFLIDVELAGSWWIVHFTVFPIKCCVEIYYGNYLDCYLILFHIYFNFFIMETIFISYSVAVLGILWILCQMEHFIVVENVLVSIK